MSTETQPKRGRGRPPGAKNQPAAPKEDVQQVVPAHCRACDGTDTRVIYSHVLEYGHTFQGKEYSKIVKQKHQCKDCQTITWADVHR